MSLREKLFSYRNPYDTKGSERLFIDAVRENTAFHMINCKEFVAICKSRGFSADELNDIDDLYKIPVIPTLFFKKHKLMSMPEKRMRIKATSSGTKGLKSHIEFDALGLYCGFKMVMRTTGYHKLLSLKPVNYIILGYQPNRTNKTAVSQTAFGATFFAPALHREYALKYDKGSYRLDMEGLKEALLRYGRLPFPVRFMGFPSYTYFFLNELKKDGIRLKLPKGSRILLGGGWKQFYTERVEKEVLYALAEEVLGIPESACTEFFGAVEHPILYTDCKCHHFHIPVYSRVIIRDVNTLMPVENGKAGLVNLITPMVASVPLTSVMTDDIGILHNAEECSCGIDSPFLEIIGRVGIRDIKRCG